MKRLSLPLHLVLVAGLFLAALLPAIGAFTVAAAIEGNSSISAATSFEPADDLLVTFPGNYATAAGLGADWSPDNTNTQASDDNGDGVWKFVTDAIPAGDWVFKATVGGSWDENYGVNGQPGGADVAFTVAENGDTVHLYYDRSDNYVASRPNYIIPVVAGNFLAALGGQDWSPDHLMSWMKDRDGDGVYEWRAQNVPEGTWEYKVALNEGWDQAYPANNRAFTVPVGGDEVTFFYNSATNEVSERVGATPPPPLEYAVMHYFRPAGDYGTPGPDFNTFWGLHLWGEAIAPNEGTAWTEPKPFSYFDESGASVAIKLHDATQPVNFIIHRGDTKDTPPDRSFNPLQTPVVWTVQDDPAHYGSRAEAWRQTVIHYQRGDGDYDGWGLHLWGDGLADGEATEWDTPKLPDGFDDYGAYFEIALADATQPVNFIVHKGDDKDPDVDRSYTPAEQYAIWLQSGDPAMYSQRGAAEDFALIHYRRSQGDYEGWGLHVWTGSAEEDVTWTEPLLPAGQDSFGIYWRVRLVEDATQLAYIIHKGDEKDPGPDQSIVFAEVGYEIWQVQGNATQFTDPAIAISVLEGAGLGDLSLQQAYWVDAETILWPAATSSGYSYSLHYDPDAGLSLDEFGISGGDAVTLTLHAGGASEETRTKFPHLAELPALRVAAADVAMAPSILKGQFAVQAVDGEGALVDATGLQIPGVLDDLYSYEGELGLVWADGGEAPALKVWAPTAQTVTLHLFDDADPTTTSAVHAMAWDADTGVWSVNGTPEWMGKYYLYEVQVFAPATGNIETNLVTDPYSLSLAMNSTRSQIVDLRDPALAPAGWGALTKPALAAPEDISIYEVHVRDFSVHDPLVPDELKGTFLAFTLPDTHGARHLRGLQQAGLTHLHLLPVFDIATINEDKSQWQEPDAALLATYPPDSELQQAAVTAVEDLDGFNWGYDPFHYTVPEGSYSTNPDGATRIVEFRQMVQALNQMGLRVVVDVVYNHTNASGQSPRSVLDRVVPGYYHRLNKDGKVETSTCCPNTASEHDMFEKLMIDSLLVWAKEYKVDAFRFDLMGHHMLRNMEKVRAALDALTLEQDGVDGKSIYLYGEGWNFGEVADNARGVNATQLNVGGLGIGTFSDRLRDAVRGAGPFANKEELKTQGFADGLYYDPNDFFQGTPEQQHNRLLLLSDQIRVGMAGNLANYVFEDRTGALVKGSQVDYNGQPAGYTLDPQEDITYVSKHDNQTLYDIYVYGLPAGTSMADRVRVQNVALSTVLLGQGVPFLHAGSDLLRSKSLDRDSFNSGDWFNKLDFTYQDNNFGVGLPVAGKNADNWDIMRPLLADAGLKPAGADIEHIAALAQELLQLRYSSPLFRLQTAHDIQRRVAFHNTGPDQLPGLIVMSITDIGVPDLDPDLERVVVLVNANDQAQTFASALAGRRLELHPVQQNSVDPVVKTASFNWQTGEFIIPGRTTAVFVERQLRNPFISFPGDYVQQLGGYNWDAADNRTLGRDVNGDGVWKFVTSRLSAGNYRFRVAVGRSWMENYGAGGSPIGGALAFTVPAEGELIHFYYDRSDNTIATRPGVLIPVAAGSFGAAIGGQDWAPDHLGTWMKDHDGDGVYTFETIAIPPGAWAFKVALNESWAESYPAGDVGFTVPAGGARVLFTYEAATHEVGVEITPFDTAPPPTALLVTFPGSYPEAAGLGPNWSPDNLNTQASDANGDGVWKFVTAAIPAGNYEFKAAVGGSWDENYGQGGVKDGPNVPFSLSGGETVHFYYDRSDHWVASRPDSRIVVLVGNLMEAVGGANWSPDNLKGWMKDRDGDGVYEITLDLPAGDYEYKVAINEGWDENYGAGGQPGGDNIALTVPAGGAPVTFTFDDETKQIAHTLGYSSRPATPAEMELVRPVVQHAIQDQVFYFVLPDRFDNGDPSNDYGDDPGGDADADVIRHGFRPTDKAFYHGGDFAGLMNQLDYLEALGITALWLTPPYANKPTQPDSTTSLGVGASYHGYWILDYENADPHLGSNEELRALIDAAHARGMTVFFDIVANHTADVITYQEGLFSYRSKADYPYRDADGAVFDDRDYVGGDTFPALDAAVSFPYTPVIEDPAFAEAKNPDWLNNPIYYHNRGNSTFRGENSLYGDFFGLDDLFTEHPVVVNGFIDIFKNLIDSFDIDGFRIDTVKHVNIEFWQQLAPEVMAYAQAQGKEDFFMFGEVFGEDPAFRSQYTSVGELGAVLDFGLHGASHGFAVSSTATDNLRDFFATDDYYTDTDSNAYQLANFISNHDIGRIGYSLQNTLPGAADGALVARSRLAHGLMYFARGFPIVYYGDEQGFTGSGGDKDARQDMMSSQVAEYNDDVLIGTTATTADANFDATHPVFQALADFAGVLDGHTALRRGAQIHRYSSNTAGIYAFSRIEREEQVEYIVALNNATSTGSASFVTYSPSTTFTAVYPAGAAGFSSDSTGAITVQVPALDLAIYKANQPIPASMAAPHFNLAAPAQFVGRQLVQANIPGNQFLEVTFAARVGEGDWAILGADDNPPYRISYDASDLPEGATLTFLALVSDLHGNVNAAEAQSVVAIDAGPGDGPTYAVIHYFRPDGAYDDWQLHLWGNGLDDAEITEWDSPKPWNGEDAYGVFAFIRVNDPSQQVGYIVHMGDDKDTPNDRFFTPAQTPEIYIVQGDANNYLSAPAALGYVTLHYQRPGGDYDGWGLHLWGDAIDPAEGTEWDAPKLPDGFDDYGAYFNIQLQDASQAVNFIIHKGDDKDTDADRSFVPAQTGDVWLKQGDAAVYEQRGAAEGFAQLHYRRPAGDYGDYDSADSTEFWGLHLWGDTTESVEWQQPLKPIGQDRFGVIFRVGLTPNPVEIGYILHRGDEKDPGPDQFLNFATHGYEVWQLQGANPDAPYILPK